MSNDRKTCYSPEYPDKSQEPGVQRGPKDGMGEQRPKWEGRAFVNYARKLGLCPVGCGKLSKSFKQGKHCEIRMFRKLSLAIG